MSRYEVKTGSISDSAIAVGAGSKAVNKRREPKESIRDIVVRLDEVIRALDENREEIPHRKVLRKDSLKLRDELTRDDPDPGRVRKLLDRIAVGLSSVDALADIVTKIQALAVSHFRF